MKQNIAQQLLSKTHNQPLEDSHSSNTNETNINNASKFELTKGEKAFKVDTVYMKLG